MGGRIVKFERENLRTGRARSPPSGEEVGLQLIQINLQADVKITIFIPVSIRIEAGEPGEVPILMPEIFVSPVTIWNRSGGEVDAVIHVGSLGLDVVGIIVHVLLVLSDEMPINHGCIAVWLQIVIMNRIAVVLMDGIKS